MNVAADLLSRGEPAEIAIYAGSTEVSYRDLRDQVDRAARALAGRGHRRQDRIAIWAENSVFFVVSYLAVIRAGMVAVPLSTDSVRASLSRILDDAGVRTMLVSARHKSHMSAWAAERKVAVLGDRDLLEADPGYAGALPEMDSVNELAALMFTSGSTGTPKGVMVTHDNISSNTDDIVRYLDLQPSDRVMVVLPFSYCFGLSLLHTHLAVGGSVVLNNQFMYPQAVLQEMRDRACTGLAGVPSTYQILLRCSSFTQSPFPDLRWLQQAGGHLPNRSIQELVDAFPRVRFYVMYGQTEATARLSYLPPELVRDKLGSIGRGLRSTTLEVLRPDGAPVTPGTDEVGEIVASGRNVARGYWNDAQETAQYFRAGKLHTGDLARIDADGFIYLVEREREIIKSGGRRTSAKEIEDVIAELSEVVEVAVVGAPHETLGEAIVAFVVVTPSAVQDRVPDVLEHSRRRLAASQIPEAVVYLSALPLSGNGKVLKGSLKEFAVALLSASNAQAVASQTLIQPLKIDLRTAYPSRLA